MISNVIVTSIGLNTLPALVVKQMDLALVNADPICLADFGVLFHGRGDVYFRIANLRNNVFMLPYIFADQYIDVKIAFFIKFYIFGSDPEIYFLANFSMRVIRQGNHKIGAAGIFYTVFFDHFGGEEIHHRVADETRDKFVFRAGKYFFRCARLLNNPVMHDNDFITKRNRFDLIMGDINHIFL